jgi:UrcA family protein
MKTLTVTAGMALLAGAGVAQAQGPTTVVGDSPYVERVAYQPSDLASGSGIRDLRSRVRSAAHRVCDLGHDSATAEYRERTCYQATLPEALAQIDQVAARIARGEMPKATRIVVAAR